MMSTSLGYRLYANDIGKSLQRTGAEPQNAAAQSYFQANIGKVTSVDDFLNNYKLFTYAMTAYGLQDLGNAKALMKKVLESNLSDPNSFANRMSDSRYKAFAQAFQFTTTGAVASTGQAQTNAQRQDTLSRLNLSTSATSSPASIAASAAIESQLASIHSISDLESNSDLYSTVLSAYGLDPSTTPMSTVTQALEAAPSDPMFTLPGALELRQLRQDFNFGKDGSAGPQTAIQSFQSIQSTVTAYLAQAGTSTTAKAAAQQESAYYLKTIPTLISVDDLVSNPRLVTYVKSALGLDATMTPSQLRDVLTSNLSDPTSVANTMKPATPVKTTPGQPTPPTVYQLAAEAFSVGPDGSAMDHSATQSLTAVASTASAYTASIQADAARQPPAAAAATLAAGAAETAYYQAKIGGITSVDGLLSDSRLVAYVRTAFDLPAPTTPPTPNTYSLSDLRNILTADVLSPTSAANTSGTNAQNLATSFNFTASGLVYSGPSIQTATSTTATTQAYAAAAGTTTSAKAAAQAETAYYTSMLPHLKSVDDLLGDKRLVAYVEKAYGIPTNTTTQVLRQVLTSSVTDPKGKASQLGGTYLTLAAAFDVSSTGSIQSEPPTQVQTKAGFVATMQGYLNQSMETEAGTTYGDGVRLALYFKRVAPTITSAYGILADKALTAVAQTMLGLNSLASKADIDSQARYLSSKINISDFQDPQKLDKLVARFTAMYDLQNNTNSNPVLQLFGGGGS